MEPESETAPASDVERYLDEGFERIKADVRRDMQERLERLDRRLKDFVDGKSFSEKDL